MQQAVAMKIESNGGHAIIVGAIVSAVLAIVGAVLKGIFGRKKDDADAQKTMVESIMVMAGKLETERDAHAARADKEASKNQKLQRRNMLLERTLSRNNIDAPPNDVDD